MPIVFAALLFQFQLASLRLWNVATQPPAPAPVTFAMAAPDTSAMLAPAPWKSPAAEPASTVRTANDGRASSSASTSLADPALGASLVDSQALSTIRIPDSGSDKLVGVTLPETVPSRRNWIALSIAQHAAAAFDAYSTRQAIAHGAVEDDPLMRPFAHSTGIYAAIQVCPVMLDFAARRMQRSQNNFVRHTWWVPQAVSTGLFLFSGVHNLSVAGR